ncbi:tail fiber domain-containing protein [Erwinia billingiae]|uniref:tail fiber domain-containing protein n=1 Tax=Erwinia billingiae TaxID=182337 RepID=UPI0030CD252D
MPAGTIALTNNSTTVTGTGTSFTTELKVNDFVVALVGGVAYTLGVAAIASNTSLTLIQKYDGPTTSGLTWNPVPYGTMAAITAQLAAQVTYAIRSLNLDKNNWQQVFTGTGNITVNLPDGSSYTGPAWNGISASISGLSTAVSGKMDKSQNLNDVADKGLARFNIGVSYGGEAGTVAQGNDSRITGALQKTGGTMTGTITANMPRGSFAIIKDTGSGGGQLNTLAMVRHNSTQYATYDFLNNGANLFSRIIVTNGSAYKTFNFMDNGNGVCDGQWIGGSDERHKSNIKVVPDALRAVMSWRGCTYDKKDGLSEVGLIAQDIEKDCPLAVLNTGRREYSDGTVIEDFKSLNVAGVSAAYHTEAIKALFSLVELALVDPEKALSSIDDIKAAISKGDATS